MVGFSAAREAPIVTGIALGSRRNKLLFLLPSALALSFVAPWGITLLVLHGAYLCYEKLPPRVTRCEPVGFDPLRACTA